MNILLKIEHLKFLFSESKKKYLTSAINFR